CLDLFVRHALKGRIAQSPVHESLRERSERRALASRAPGGAKHLRIGCQQLGRRRQSTAEPLLDARHDRARRSDRQLLTDDLENECPERIQRRELLHPCSRTKSWRRIDDAREHRIGFAKELASLSVGERGALLRTSTHAHALSRRSVSTISMTSATVSSRAQSRWSSTASATQVTGCAPAWTTPSRPARSASSLVPPIASTTGYTSSPSRNASSAGKAMQISVQRAQRISLRCRVARTAARKSPSSQALVVVLSIGGGCSARRGRLGAGGRLR